MRVLRMRSLRKGLNWKVQFNPNATILLLRRRRGRGQPAAPHAGIGRAVAPTGICARGEGWVLPAGICGRRLVVQEELLAHQQGQYLKGGGVDN
eukprot:scaffold29168_cov67-Isochrysis_galbana.AAC.1